VVSHLPAGQGAPRSLVALALVGIVASGCSATSAPRPEPQTVGIVTGVASPCWPYTTNKGIEKALVKVAVTQGEKTVASQSIRGDHVYRFALAPGSYLVSTPYSRPQLVTIAIGRTVKADLPDDCI
jgi:hypothetical protein